MKVGILTYHWVSNFGANLQALSTYSKIQKMGHTPVIINWIPHDLHRYYETSVTEAQNVIFKQFQEKHFTSITTICKDSKEIATEILRNDIDLIIVGSDAVFTYIPYLCRVRLTKKGLKYFKPCIDSDFPNPFWGDFLKFLNKDIRLVAMSASAQNTKYNLILNPIRRNKFKSSLLKFNSITVRDIWTKKMIMNLTNNKLDPQITPDPVFSFEQNVEYNINFKEILNRLNIKRKYILISFSSSYLSESWLTRFVSLYNQKGIDIYFLPQVNLRFECPFHINSINTTLNPLEWYCLIKHSEGYVGELMHPILVSLHNSVPVFAFDTYGFISKGKLNSESSKTFQIMLYFGLLDNYTNVKIKNNIPQPEFVMEKLSSFNRKECKLHAIRLQKLYENMMSDILN